MALQAKGELIAASMGIDAEEDQKHQAINGEGSGLPQEALVELNIRTKRGVAKLEFPK